jgi:hypothetical protein
MSSHAPGQAEFDELVSLVTAGVPKFGHREHVHLTWLAVRQYGMPAAITFVSDGIQTTARYANAPQKYHATMSRAWVELVSYHIEENDARDFDQFIALSPALLGKRLLTDFYNSTTLASPSAREGWIEPDRAPFPRH